MGKLRAYCTHVFFHFVLKWVIPLILVSVICIFKMPWFINIIECSRMVNYNTRVVMTRKRPKTKTPKS